MHFVETRKHVILLEVLENILRDIPACPLACVNGFKQEQNPVGRPGWALTSVCRRAPARNPAR